MTYSLGTLVPLVGGGYVAAYEQTASGAAVPTIDLYVQRYDADKHAIGSPILAGEAFSNPTTGASASVYDVDLAAAPYGGFDVAFLSHTTQGYGWPEFDVAQGLMVSPSGAQTPFQTYIASTLTQVAPHIVPLAAGGLVIQQDWSLDFIDTQGQRTLDVGEPGGPVVVRDLVSFVEVTTTTSDGVWREHVFGLDPLTNAGPLDGITTLHGGEASDSLIGTAGPDSLAGGDGADTLAGAHGFDVLSGGAGADVFQFWLDGTVDRVTDFDNSQDTFQLFDLQGGALSADPAAVIAFDARTGALTWDDDGSGPHAAVVFGMLDGVAKVTGANMPSGGIDKIVSLEASGGSTVTQFSQAGASTRWSVTHFEPDGQVNTFAVQNADGTSWKNWYDVTNQQPWSVTTANYDAAGRLVEYDVRADDGSLTVYHFDPTNAQPWDRIVDQSDTQGRLFERDIVNDDGSHWEVTYDVANTQPWDHEVQIFDPGGKLVSNTFFNADGSVFTG